MFKTVRKIAVNIAASLYELTNRNQPILEKDEIDLAIDYALAQVSAGIQSGAIVGEDAIVDAYLDQFKNFQDHYEV